MTSQRTIRSAPELSRPRREAGAEIRAVSRALLVLKAVNRLGTCRLKQISDLTRLPYPTVFRLVQALVYEGMLEQAPDCKRYRVTELVKMLSFGFQRDDMLVANAHAQMLAFTQEYDWPVALSVRVGRRMVVKHSTSPYTTYTFANYYAGYTFPILECASGRAYVAFCEEWERRMIMEDVRMRPPKEQSLSADDILRGDLLETIRADGYATMVRSQINATPGKTSAIAVPVTVDGEVVACLGLTFFCAAMSMDCAIERYVGPLRGLSAEVAESLRESNEDFRE